MALLGPYRVRVDSAPGKISSAGFTFAAALISKCDLATVSSGPGHRRVMLWSKSADICAQKPDHQEPSSAPIRPRTYSRPAGSLNRAAFEVFQEKRSRATTVRTLPVRPGSPVGLSGSHVRCHEKSKSGSELARVRAPGSSLAVDCISNRPATGSAALTFHNWQSKGSPSSLRPSPGIAKWAQECSRVRLRVGFPRSS